MATESVNVLVEGGKATAAPPLGPALGPLGVNIGQVVAKINQDTADFKGMRVPVTVTVDKSTRAFTIEIGTPPTAELVKKEAGIEKGAGNPLLEKVADLRIEQIIKIANMKKARLLGKDSFSRVKEVCGTCDSMGVLVEGKPARETIADINAGAFKEKIKSGKTELSAEELKALAEEKKRLAADLAEKRKEYEIKAKSILASMPDKSASSIRTKMREEKIPEAIIKELVPEAAAAGGAGGAGGGAGGAPAGAKK